MGCTRSMHPVIAPVNLSPFPSQVRRNRGVQKAKNRQVANKQPCPAG